jgi:hypothetical protein
MRCPSGSQVHRQQTMLETKAKQKQKQRKRKTLANTWVQLSRSNISPEIQIFNQTRPMFCVTELSGWAVRKIPPTLREFLTPPRALWVLPQTRSKNPLARIESAGQDVVELSWFSCATPGFNGASSCLVQDPVWVEYRGGGTKEDLEPWLGCSRADE